MTEIQMKAFMFSNRPIYVLFIEKVWVVSIFLPSTEGGDLASVISEAINDQRHPHQMYWELREHCYSYSYTAIQRAVRVNALLLSTC